MYVGKGQCKRYLNHLKTLKANSYFKNKLKKIYKINFINFDIKSYILIFRNNLLEQEALSLEKDLINKIGRFGLKKGPLTNLTNGGDGLSNPSDEVKKKISDTLTGRKVSEKTKQKIAKALKGKMAGKNNPFFGKHHSEKTKQRLSIVHSNNTWALGNKLSEETKQKIRLCSLGGTHSEETKQKLSLLNKGKKHSLESRQLMCKKQKGENNPRSKLSERQVHQIHMLLKLGFKNKDISDMYGQKRGMYLIFLIILVLI